MGCSKDEEAGERCEEAGERCGSASQEPAYVSIRQHTSAYVSIRQHTSAYNLGGRARKGGHGAGVLPQVKQVKRPASSKASKLVRGATELASCLK